MSDRRTQVRANLATVRERIDAAARAAGRDPGSVTLIVVTKTFPADDVQLLADLGVTDVGENRHPEAQHKAAAVSADLTWHFVGALQTNKARAVARYAHVVHSVDRDRLITALSEGAQRADRELDCLVQVSLDPPETAHRSGAPPDRVVELADRVTAADGLRLRGVMAVAPLGADAAAAFAHLSEVAAEVRSVHPAADVMSAGMSDDLESAVAAGATHVRIGRAVLGERPPLG